MKKVVVFLADGFEEGEALLVVDILRRARVEVVMASVKGRLEVISSRYIHILADALVEEIDFSTVDMVVLPGGRLGTENLSKCEIVKEQCKRFTENGYVAAICAAPSILSGLGLIKEKKATCHPDFENRMAETVVVNESTAIDGNIITGQGLGAIFPFAFELVRILADEQMVEKIKKDICFMA